MKFVIVSFLLMLAKILSLKQANSNDFKDIILNLENYKENDIFYDKFLENYANLNTQFQQFLNKTKEIDSKLSLFNMNYKNNFNSLIDLNNKKFDKSSYKNNKIISGNVKSISTNGQKNLTISNFTSNSTNFTDNKIPVSSLSFSNDITIIKDNEKKETKKNLMKMLIQLTGFNKSEVNNSTLNSQLKEVANSTNITLSADSNLLVLNLLSENLKDNISKINVFHKNFIENFSKFEAVFKEKNLQTTKKKYESTLLFYNSLSLIMLAMLAGGLVGIIFILYFSFHNKEIINN